MAANCTNQDQVKQHKSQREGINLKSHSFGLEEESCPQNIVESPSSLLTFEAFPSYEDQDLEAKMFTFKFPLVTLFEFSKSHLLSNCSFNFKPCLSLKKSLLLLLIFLSLPYSLAQNPKQSPQQAAKSQDTPQPHPNKQGDPLQNSQDSLSALNMQTKDSVLTNSTLDSREIVSLNNQLKSKSIIGLLFMVALFLVVFRFSKKCELMRQKLPKALSLFWFVSTCLLYLDLNIFQIERKSYAKNIFIGISPIDHSYNYLPEVLHLILLLVSLFYTFALLFRFHDMQGKVEDSEGELLFQAEPAAHELSFTPRQRDQGGFVIQSLIQVSGLTWRSSLEFYHLSVILFILFLTFVKLVMLHTGILFVRINSFSVNTLDNLELFTNSPRILALFTVSFLAFSQFVGQSTTDKQQYFFQKIIPFLVVVLHSAAVLLKRNLILTYDDIFCGVIFLTSLCLYYTYESPDAIRSNRLANPFLHFNAGLNAETINPDSPNSFDNPQGIQKNGPTTLRFNLSNLSDQEKLKWLIQNKKESELLKLLESQNEVLAKSISQEEIKLRKAQIDEELRKRREEYEEFTRQKKLMMAQRSSARYQSDPEESADEYEDGNLVNDELDEDDYESSDNEDQPAMMGTGLAGTFNPNERQLIEYISKLGSISSQETHQKLQEFLLQQYNQQLVNEETLKLFTMKGLQTIGQKIQQQKEQELMQKLGLQATQTQTQTQNTQQQQQQRGKQQSLKVLPQNANTQGGQGQQQVHPANPKGTAHKMPTKAPSGRPNQRKRR